MSEMKKLTIENVINLYMKHGMIIEFNDGKVSRVSTEKGHKLELMTMKNQPN